MCQPRRGNYKQFAGVMLAPITGLRPAHHVGLESHAPGTGIWGSNKIFISFYQSCSPPGKTGSDTVPGCITIGCHSPVAAAQNETNHGITFGWDEVFFCTSISVVMNHKVSSTHA